MIDTPNYIVLYKPKDEYVYRTFKRKRFKSKSAALNAAKRMRKRGFHAKVERLPSRAI